MPNSNLLFEGELAPAPEKEYVYLAFEMPPDALRLQVEYSYSQQIDSDPALSGGNTIDLGVFDARGGDILSYNPEKELAVQIQCQSGARHVLQLLDQSRVLFERTLSEQDECMTARVCVDHSFFVRAELRGTDDSMKALTNPIYLVGGMNQ